MAALTPGEIDAFLAEPLDAVLSVALASGRAMGTPIWFRWVDGVARFQSPTTSAKTSSAAGDRAARVCASTSSRCRWRATSRSEGPVREVDFDLDADIGAAAQPLSR